MAAIQKSQANIWPHKREEKELNHEKHEWHEIEKRIVCCSFVSFVFFVVKAFRELHQRLPRPGIDIHFAALDGLFEGKARHLCGAKGIGIER